MGDPHIPWYVHVFGIPQRILLKLTGMHFAWYVHPYDGRMSFIGLERNVLVPEDWMPEVVRSK